MPYPPKITEVKSEPAPLLLVDVYGDEIEKLLNRFGSQPVEVQQQIIGLYIQVRFTQR